MELKIERYRTPAGDWFVAVEIVGHLHGNTTALYIDLPTPTEPRYRIDLAESFRGRARHYRKTEAGVESFVEAFMMHVGYPLDPGALLIKVGGWTVE